MNRPSITCPTCGRTSYHPMDVAEGYCGHCHWWTSDPKLAPLRGPFLPFWRRHPFLRAARVAVVVGLLLELVVRWLTRSNLDDQDEDEA